MSIYLSWLVDAARSAGLKVVEINGWRTRGHGGMRVTEGVVGHHTGTAASAPGDYPSLNVVTNGRSDLAGPLCNYGLGRDGTVYVVAAGCAWHAGVSAWAGFSDLNDEFLGIEAESSGNGVWTAAQRDAYPRLVAAILRYIHRDPTRYAGHKDVALPKGRKVDPTGIDTAWMQTTARSLLSGGGGAAAGGTITTTGEDDDMSLTPPPHPLVAGTNRSETFRIPAWARYITINCPVDAMTVHNVIQAQDAAPPPTASDPAPFGFITETQGAAKDKRVDRLRPWLIPVGPGANHGVINYTYAPDHPERAGDLSFAP